MTTYFLTPLLVILLILSLTACGKKGPPVPPDAEPKKESSYP